MLKRIKEWFKKVDWLVSIILVGALIFIFIFPDKVLSLYGKDFLETPKGEKQLEVWVTLERQVAFVDKATGKVILMLDPELAKVVMVSQLKLYEVEELKALKKELQEEKDTKK